jgi:hypothetical protein
MNAKGAFLRVSTPISGRFDHYPAWEEVIRGNRMNIG